MMHGRQNIKFYSYGQEWRLSYRFVFKALCL